MEVIYKIEKEKYMKVKHLKKLLNLFNDEDIVIISKDGEGNSYSPLEDVYECNYKPETTWCGQIGLRELTPHELKLGYTEKDVLEDGINAIVLYPVN